MTKPNLQYSIGSCRYQADRITGESLAHPQSKPLQKERSSLLNFAHIQSVGVLQGLKLLKKTPQPRLKTRTRTRQSQGFMRSNPVVLFAPTIQRPLQVGSVLPLPSTEKLSFQCAVKTFILTQGLGMIGPTVADRDSQPNQPDGQGRIRMLGIRSPRTAVVYRNAIGQSITAKGISQSVFDAWGLLIRQCLETKIKARMVIEHGQRVSLTCQGFDRPFKVHLPQTVRHRVLKTLPILSRHFAFDLHQTVTVKYSGDGASSRNALDCVLLEQLLDFARSPHPVLLAPLDNRLLFGLAELMRKTARATRQIHQAATALTRMALEPLVAGLAAYLIALAQFLKAHGSLLCQSHKFFSQRHGAHLFPRHLSLPSLFDGTDYAWSKKCYPCLRYICYLCVRSIHWVWVRVRGHCHASSPSPHSSPVEGEEVPNPSAGHKPTNVALRSGWRVVVLAISH